MENQSNSFPCCILCLDSVHRICPGQEEVPSDLRDQDTDRPWEAKYWNVGASIGIITYTMVLFCPTEVFSHVILRISKAPPYPGFTPPTLNVVFQLHGMNLLGQLEIHYKIMALDSQPKDKRDKARTRKRRRIMLTAPFPLWIPLGQTPEICNY